MKQQSSKYIISFAATMTLFLSLLVAVALSGQAGASALASKKRQLPDPVPTVVVIPPVNASVTPNPSGTVVVPGPVPTGVPVSCSINFSDVASTDWYYEHVQWVLCNGIAGGYTDGTFRPANNTTRAQIAKMIVVASRWPLRQPTTPTFSDVDPGTTFYMYVETAAFRGIAGGYSDGTFRPNNYVTRGQLSKMTVLARNWTLTARGRASFSDVPLDSTFSVYIEAAAEKGIVGGYSDGTFRPGNNATRAQLSKIVQNAFTTP